MEVAPGSVCSTLRSSLSPVARVPTIEKLSRGGQESNICVEHESYRSSIIDKVNYYSEQKKAPTDKLRFKTEHDNIVLKEN